MIEKFTSLHHPLAVDGGLGRIAQQEDYAAHVEEMMRQVLLTNPGERVNRPDFGCGLRRMVFAPASEASASLLQVTILQAMKKWLGPVIEVDEVRVNADNEKFVVVLAYRLTVRRERRYLNVEVAL